MKHSTELSHWHDARPCFVHHRLQIEGTLLALLCQCHICFFSICKLLYCFLRDRNNSYAATTIPCKQFLLEIACSALTLLVLHPSCKTWVIRCSHSFFSWSAVQIICICHCHLIVPCYVYIQNGVPFWCWLNGLSWKRNNWMGVCLLLLESRQGSALQVWFTVTLCESTSWHTSVLNAV